MFTWIKETISSQFSRRRPPDKNKSNAFYYIGAGHNPSKDDKMHLYLFHEKPIRMDLCIRHGDRLDGKRVSEGGQLISVHLNHCIKGSLETAMRDGLIIELTSKTKEEAFEEAKGYQIVLNSDKYCQVGIKDKKMIPIRKSNNKTLKNRI
jgi:hypothetical protein